MVFMKQSNLPFNSLHRGSCQQVDLLLENFVNHMHSKKSQNKSALRVTKHAVLFIQIIRPRTRMGLKATWATVKSWEEMEPSQLRAPLPLAILVGLLCHSRAKAETRTVNERDRKRLLIFSALVGMGFFGLLRPGELLRLTPNDLGLPNQLTFGTPCVTLRINKPKNFRRLGTSQFAVIYQPDVCNWASWLKHQGVDLTVNSADCSRAPPQNF